MKIIQWNFSKEISPMSGIKRYEDELFGSIQKVFPDLVIERIHRKAGKYRGSFCVSWVLRPRSKDADIVHATLQTFAPVSLFRKPRIFMVTVHDLIPLLYPSVIRDISTRLQWQFTPDALKKVDHIIAISEFTKKELIRILGIKEEKISVIYQGVNHSVYQPLNKEECKKQFNLSTKEKHILVVASNEEHKRMDLVVQVYNEIKKKRDDIKLIKVGYGQLLRDEGIINPGWIEESRMPVLYNAADIYLHTAEYEGFGLPVLEAMSCGTPVAVSNKASLPEIVGESGQLVDLNPETCVDNFVQAILAIIDRGYDSGLVERSNLFNWEKTAKETVKVYQKLLK